MERVNLLYEYGRTQLARWENGWTLGPYLTVVTVGQLADGRWYAERQGRGASRRDLREGTCVYGSDDRGRWLAERAAQCWRRCRPGTWVIDGREEGALGDRRQAAILPD